MAYSWTLIDNVFAVRWKALTVADLTRILLDLRNARRVIPGKMIYLSITPADHPVPGAAERNALKEFAEAAAGTCDAVHLVIEGDTIKHSMQRTSVTALLWLMQQSTIPMAIHKQVEAAAQAIAPLTEHTPDALLKLLRSRNLLT